MLCSCKRPRQLHRLRPAPGQGGSATGLGGLGAQTAHRPTRLNSVETQQVAVLQDRWDAVGVDVVVKAPTLKGGQPSGMVQACSIRLDPAIVSQGARLMLTALNHEAIHRVQTCKAGGFDH